MRVATDRTTYRTGGRLTVVQRRDVDLGALVDIDGLHEIDFHGSEGALSNLPQSAYYAGSVAAMDGRHCFLTLLQHEANGPGISGTNREDILVNILLLRLEVVDLLEAKQSLGKRQAPSRHRQASLLVGATRSEFLEGRPH